MFQCASGTSVSASDTSRGSSGGEVRGSNISSSVGAPGPPLKRNRASTEENLEDASEDGVKLQAFSTARDEYVSG